jgi:hypothetical protein
MQHFNIISLPDRKIIYFKFLAEFDRPSLAAAIQALYDRKPAYLEYKPIYDFRSYAGGLVLRNLISPILIFRNKREHNGLPRILPGNKAFLWSNKQGLQDHQIRIAQILDNPHILSTTSDVQAWQWVSGERGLPPALLSSYSYRRDSVLTVSI